MVPRPIPKSWASSIIFLFRWLSYRLLQTNSQFRNVQSLKKRIVAAIVGELLDNGSKETPMSSLMAKIIDCCESVKRIIGSILIRAASKGRDWTTTRMMNDEITQPPLFYKFSKLDQVCKYITIRCYWNLNVVNRSYQTLEMKFFFMMVWRILCI